MSPIIKYTIALLALSAPILFSAAFAADAQFMHPDSQVQKTYPILSKFNAGRIPSERILNRGDHDIYAILHFGPNTFYDKEWGYGDEDPQRFAPTEFDAEQIVKACKDGGITGIIIVCKHHDGLCLWPTKTTEHNITKTKFRDSKGDYVKEMTDACRKYGLDVGFYVSPWDRNNPKYGTPDYLPIFQEQLREVLSNYGPAFEVFLDGANGGDGYYGGARERRNIDHRTYYDWVHTWQIIRELQPGAAIFSDVGPDVRWIGNEAGTANAEAFGSFTPHAPRGQQGEAMPGFCNTGEANSGHKDGVFFIPGDCDVPFRPGWFYHTREDNAQKSVQHLINIYLRSAGSGAYMNLGMAPDKRGLIHENDVKRLKEFKAALDSLFANKVFGDEVKIENNVGTVEFGGTKRLNFIKMAEFLSSTQGELVSGYEVDVRRNGQWSNVVKGKAIGLKRLKPIPTQDCDAVRIRITESSGTVKSMKFSGYLAPENLIGVKALVTENDIRKLPNYRKQETISLIGQPARAAEFSVSPDAAISGIIFTPVAGAPLGTPDRCSVEIQRGGQWVRIVEYEFSNIKANPVPQLIPLDNVKTNRIRIHADRFLDDNAKKMVFAEIGILLAE